MDYQIKRPTAKGSRKALVAPWVRIVRESPTDYEQKVLTSADVKMRGPGDPTPSADDRVVTRQLVDAGRILDVPVYDHVIIAGNRFTSFAEAGLL